LPLTAVFLFVAVGALAFRARRRRGFGPFFVGLAASAIVLAGDRSGAPAAVRTRRSSDDPGDPNWNGVLTVEQLMSWDVPSVRLVYRGPGTGMPARRGHLRLVGDRE
jgi:hypothetical protein